jgi:hypothetical protein
VREVVILMMAGVRAEFKITTEMRCENESENEHFCESKGRV